MAIINSKNPPKIPKIPQSQNLSKTFKKAVPAINSSFVLKGTRKITKKYNCPPKKSHF